jgi:hypothetical protein
MHKSEILSSRYIFGNTLLFCLFDGRKDGIYGGYAKTIENNAMIGTAAQLAELIEQPDYLVDNIELTALALACYQRMMYNLSSLPPLQGNTIAPVSK